MKAKISSFIGGLLLLSSCEDVITLKYNQSDLHFYAVEAKITTQDNPYVYFYTTSRVDNSSPYQGISGATVIISDNSPARKSIQLIESSEKKGLYQVPANQNFIGERGLEYTLTIRTGTTTLTATDLLKPVAHLDQIQLKPSEIEPDYLALYAYFNEPATTGDYYIWNVYVNGKMVNDPQKTVLMDDKTINGKQVRGLEVFVDYYPFGEYEKKEMKLNDKVQVKQLSLSEFGYLYFIQLRNQQGSGDLFSMPPANIASNFKSSDGKPVLGLFTASDVSISNVIIVDQEIKPE